MEYPKRKNIRLKGYDYSENSAYFITICTKGRHRILGRIFVGDAALGVPLMELSAVGNMVKQHIENINQQDDVTLEKYVIMPNHVHLLIRTDGGAPRAAPPTKATILRL